MRSEVIHPRQGLRKDQFDGAIFDFAGLRALVDQAELADSA